MRRERIRKVVVRWGQVMDLVSCTAMAADSPIGRKANDIAFLP